MSRPHDLAGALGVQIGHHDNFNAPPGAALDFFLIAAQHVESAAAHGADAQKADLDGLHMVFPYG